MKVRGFRGGSDEKMRRMWFGLEIDVVGLPTLFKPFSELECGRYRRISSFESIQF